MNAGALSKSILAAAGDSIQQECKTSGQFSSLYYTRLEALGADFYK